MVAPGARADANGSATDAVAILACAGHHWGVPRFAFLTASKSRSRKTFAGPTAEEKIVASLMELMEAGPAPWRRPWDGTGHLVNLISGHRYRGAKPVLLTLGMHIRLAQRTFQCDGPALPFWCGFAEARKLGIFPRKGSKAVHLLRPQLHSREEPGEGGEVTLKSWASYPGPIRSKLRAWISWLRTLALEAARLRVAEVFIPLPEQAARESCQRRINAHQLQALQLSLGG